MKVHFKDTLAEVRELRYSGTYDGHMEGTYASISQYLLQELFLEAKNNVGHLVLPAFRNEDKGELKDFRYDLYARTDYEHRIFITWFGDAMSDEGDIVESIERVTKHISFMMNCQEIDLDDML